MRCLCPFHETSEATLYILTWEEPHSFYPVLHALKIPALSFLINMSAFFSELITPTVCQADNIIRLSVTLQLLHASFTAYQLLMAAYVFQVFPACHSTGNFEVKHFLPMPLIVFLMVPCHLRMSGVISLPSFVEIYPSFISLFLLFLFSHLFILPLFIWIHSWISICLCRRF